MNQQSTSINTIETKLLSPLPLGICFPALVSLPVSVLPAKSPTTHRSAPWMCFPVSFSLHGHVWHSKQTALEAVDEKDWHSPTWLILSLMKCTAERKRHFTHSFCFQHQENLFFLKSRIFLYIDVPTNTQTKYQQHHKNGGKNVKTTVSAARYCKSGWPVQAVIGLSGSIMYFWCSGKTGGLCGPFKVICSTWCKYNYIFWAEEMMNKKSTRVPLFLLLFSPCLCPVADHELCGSVGGPGVCASQGAVQRSQPRNTVWMHRCHRGAAARWLPAVLPLSRPLRQDGRPAIPWKTGEIRVLAPSLTPPSCTVHLCVKLSPEVLI